MYGFAHSLTLPLDAKFNDVYRAIYRPQGNSSSRGSLRMLREQGAQIWRIDETGSGNHESFMYTCTSHSLFEMPILQYDLEAMYVDIYIYICTQKRHIF